MSTNLITLTGNSPGQYLCLFHLITAGLFDDQLGSDEQEIIEMIYLIIDIEQNKVDECQANIFSSMDFYRLWLYIDSMFDRCLLKVCPKSIERVVELIRNLFLHRKMI